jgi:hypothetical protein
MIGVREIIGCLGIGADGNVSILGNLLIHQTEGPDRSRHDGPRSRASPVRSWQFDRTRAEVRILELDNDVSGDDFYLHSFQVPDRGRL